MEDERLPIEEVTEEVIQGEIAESSRPRSQIATEIKDLQSTILRVASERERLPQPLFWSLFRSRLNSIKRDKELVRLVSEELG